MHPFSSNRTKRNTILMTLLVWLFALASGMANACLLEAPGKHPHTAANHSSDAHLHPLAGHAVAVEDDQDASRDSCLKACNDGANAQVKLQNAVDAPDPGPAPFAAVVWDRATPFVSASGSFDILRAPIAGPSFRVRYSRLTL